MYSDQNNTLHIHHPVILIPSSLVVVNRTQRRQVTESSSVKPRMHILSHRTSEFPLFNSWRDGRDFGTDNFTMGIRSRLKATTTMGHQSSKTEIAKRSSHTAIEWMAKKHMNVLGIAFSRSRSINFWFRGSSRWLAARRRQEVRNCGIYTHEKSFLCDWQSAAGVHDVHHQ